MTARYFLLLVFCTLGVSLLAPRAPGAVFERDWKTPGDGLLTYDNVNRREWLDLTETQLLRFPGDTLGEHYQAVVTETLPGGMFAEFTVASSSDVRALAESAGIETSTSNSDINRQEAGKLIDLLGRSYTSVSIGAVADLDIDSSVSVFLFSGREEALAGWRIADSTSALKGVWLYRQVPEPATSMLLAVVGSLLFTMQRLSRSVV